MRNFSRLIKNQWKNNHFICVGLDSNLDKIPESARRASIVSTLTAFNRQIVNATKDIVCAYKPNVAFYEDQGPDGMKALLRTIEYIHRAAPDVPVILDAKRGDIGSSNAAYVKALFEIYQADAVTVHPYLGAESLQNFLDQKDKGVIVLCRTSNPGAGEFQDLTFKKVPLYKIIARQVAQKWNKNKNCALVVGATYPKELAEVRKIVGKMPILIPGIGAQGGNVEQTVKAGLDSDRKGIIINSSRGIIFASNDKDFAEAARNKTLELHETINSYR